jgi:myo-inositol-1(or 4)-monophosphatase
MEDLREFISSLAREAGENAKSMRATLSADDVACKATATDIVTAADKATEKLIFDRIREKYPEHRFFGEETGHSDDTASPYCWIVDPIDGTVCYLHNCHTWTVSIALYKGDEGVASAVYAPMLDELYVAIAGQGATLNGRPIHVDGLENEDFPPAFAAIAGALLYAHRNYEEKSILDGLFGRFFK